MFTESESLLKKYRYIESLKYMVEDKKWNISGRNFLGLWSKVPNGIKQLRSTLDKIPTIKKNVLEHKEEIERLFNKSLSILKSKQTSYRFLGKRLDTTQLFYTKFYEEGCNIDNINYQSGNTLESE